MGKASKVAKGQASGQASADPSTWLDKLYAYSIDHFVHWRKHLKEYAWAILIVLVVRSTLLTVYRIPTGSMIPTFKVGDVLIANHFYYGLKIPWTHGLDGLRLRAVREVSRGDILIFQGPREEPFHIIHLRFFGEAAKQKLLDLNKRSQFKRPIAVYGPGQTNYIFLKGYGDLENASHGEVVVALHRSLYKDFEILSKGSLERPLVRLQVALSNAEAEKVLDEWAASNRAEVFVFPDEEEFLRALYVEAAFYEAEGSAWLNNAHEIGVVERGEALRSVSVQRAFEHNYYMTYHSQEYRGFWRSFWNTPLTGLSIVGSVLLNTPLLLAYAVPLKAFLGEPLYGKIRLYPNPYLNNTKDYVKRVIAVEGDTVEIVNKRVFVNGEALFSSKFEPVADDDHHAYTIYRESSFVAPNSTAEGRGYRVRFNRYLNPDIPSEAFEPETWPLDPNRSQLMPLSDFKDNFGPITVAKGHYFVMGDNRDESFDSRYWGLVPHHAVKGAVMLRLLPFSRFGKIR